MCSKLAYHRIDSHWFGNVLELPGSPVFKFELGGSLYVVENRTTNENHPWLCFRFDTASDIHPIAEQIVTINDYVGEMDSDPDLKSNLLFCYWFT